MCGIGGVDEVLKHLRDANRPFDDKDAWRIMANLKMLAKWPPRVFLSMETRMRPCALRPEEDVRIKATHRQVRWISNSDGINRIDAKAIMSLNGTPQDAPQVLIEQKAE